MKVTEGVSGMWHHHLSQDNNQAKGLCGANVMRTTINIRDWGIPFGKHFPKKPTWCAECERLRLAALSESKEE